MNLQEAEKMSDSKEPVSKHSKRDKSPAGLIPRRVYFGQ
jgi:hypothetical protein